MSKLKADLLLVIVTFGWGISYLLMDVSLQNLGPFTLNSFRFLGAFFVAYIVMYPKMRSVNRTTLKYSLYVAITLVFVYIGVTFGVMYTSISNSGFLCALSVIFTPLLGFVFKKQVPDKKFLVVLVVCVTGIGLLTLDENLKPALGDILCIMCAFAYAVDLLVTETAVNHEKVNALQLGVFQLAFTGLFCLIASFIFEEPHFPQSPKVWGSVIFLSLFCTGVAFIVQAVAQQYTSASHVGVIFTLEPVFNAVAALVFAGEVLMPKGYVGGIMMIASLFIMEVDFKALFLKRKKDPLDMEEGCSSTDFESTEENNDKGNRI